VLRHLDLEYPDNARLTDSLLSRVFRKHIEAELESRLKLDIIAIFKEFDPLTEYSGTVLLPDRDVKHYYE